ncbi:MAG: hypothetical protein CVT70_13305 [Alphaproteobacteria bacterium HGW-Alphaproteobacteria-1]|jgi:FtsH-binding integral membrane protein|nr:MAG: hypothetical protein CVT70_13305 [Alphaproteobacteria bacterium HGW-Alphaproteobacteria-1]
MTNFLKEVFKSFGQALWTIASIVCAVLVFVALRDAGFGPWVRWGAALMVVVAFALVFVLAPRPWDRK